MTEKKTTTLRVGKDTDVRRLAGAIARCFENDGYDKVELISIGAGATNQAIKAIITARDFLENSGRRLDVEPRYKNIEVGERKITSICHELSIEG